MTIDLDAIQARSDAAAEGPWRVERHDLSLYVQSADEGLQANLGYVGNRPDADAEFIAAARTDVPALLTYARDLEARIGRGMTLARNLDRLAPGDRHYAGLIRAALTATEGA